MIFAAYFKLRGRDTHIDFLRSLFLVGMICPLMQEHLSLPSSSSETQGQIKGARESLNGRKNIQLFRERLSEKVHAAIPKGIVGSFEFTDF